MSFVEIKRGVAALSIEERLELAALIAHLNRAEDPAWQEELDRRLDAMQAGQKHTQSDLEKFHDDLSKRGR
jgi:hypothetical protein